MGRRACQSKARGRHQRKARAASSDYAGLCAKQGKVRRGRPGLYPQYLGTQIQR